MTDVCIEEAGAGERLARPPHIRPVISHESCVVVAVSPLIASRESVWMSVGDAACILLSVCRRSPTFMSHVSPAPADILLGA